MIKPPALKKGDLVYITAPAKAVESHYVEYAAEYFSSLGFEIKISPHCVGKFGYFSGTDQERASDLQFAFDDVEIKAIVCARGGYGCIRILDMLNWAGMLRNPKWLVGFSDITVFHHRLFNLGIQSIHGTMPLNFKTNTPEALSSMIDVLFGRTIIITCPSSTNNKIGATDGLLVGGNLSIIYSLLATRDSFIFKDAILFIEDVSEQLYHIDRMIFALKKAGVFDSIKGLIIGGMTDLKDTVDSIGLRVEQLILQHFTYSKIPISFNFPTGHIEDNRAMVIGAKVNLSVTEKLVTLSYL